MVKDQQAAEELESDRPHNEQVDGCDASGPSIFALVEDTAHSRKALVLFFAARGFDTYPSDDLSGMKDDLPRANLGAFQRAATELGQGMKA